MHQSPKSSHTEKTSSAGFDYDAELRLHDEHFRAAINVRADAHVLDIGCGTGQSTRAAARAASSGSVLGVDVSERMLDRARQLSLGEGLDNVSFLCADAQTHPFPSAQFDLCISRFGTMFFTKPAAAFGNIAHALRPSAQLVLLIWQSRESNEWATAVRQALTGTPMPTAPVTGPDAFSLGDAATTENLLSGAGFADINFSDVREPVYYGSDLAAAYDAVLQLSAPQEMLAGLTPAAAERALDRLRATIAAHQQQDGVYFDSRAWLVTARR